MKQWQSVTLGIMVGLIASALILLVSSPPRGEPITLVSQPTPDKLTVFVTGAVKNPGIYYLPIGSRAIDAVTASGGTLDNADLSVINLASFLEDSQKVLIPFIPTPIPERVEIIPTPEIPTPSPDQPLNINTAKIDELDLLPGIGPSKAAAIISYREKNGNFLRIEDILNVPGIGPSIFEQIRDLVTVEP